MTTSNAGINLIKRWEQFRAKAYQDSTGVWTIGYGHTRNVSSMSADITPAQAILYLKEDVVFAEHYVDTHFSDLKQCQFDALVSLIFNIKSVNFITTNTYRLIQENNEDKHIADEWIEFRNAGGRYLRGLMRRRLDELVLYYSW